VNSAGKEYYDKFETMSSDERERYHEQKLNDHIKYTYRYVPAVKRLFDQAGINPEDIKSMKDLEKLPITRKSDLISMQKANPPYGGVVATTKADVERVFVSPGPIYEIQPPHFKWFARSFYAAGFRQGDIVINTFTYHMSPAGVLIHEGIRDCGATVVVAGTGNTELQIQVMQELRVTGFVGTPGFLMTLIKRAENMGLDWKKNFNIHRAWFTGEMLSSSMRQVFETRYDIDTYQAYAVTEPGGAIAYECHEKHGMHLMDEFITEIVDPTTGKQCKPGEVGEIVTTQLQNPDWGLIRFGTGDLSSIIEEPCPCGRTSFRISGILGRAGDAVKVRGMFIVAKQADETIRKFSEVSRYQLVINRSGYRDIMVLKVELKQPEIDTTAFAERINANFQDVCRLKIDNVEIVTPGTISEDAPPLLDERKWD